MCNDCSVSICRVNAVCEDISNTLLLIFVECSLGTFGPHCRGKCECAPGYVCHHVTGQCQCGPDLKGKNCSTGTVELFCLELRNFIYNNGGRRWMMITVDLF